MALPLSAPKQMPEAKHALDRALTPTLLQLSGVLVYLWLWNGRSFWYYLEHAQGLSIQGYLWRGGRWYRQNLPLAHILRYY